ncbi:MAG: hypothetical protein OEZ58_04720 [Gammaproteobacteria bacterium]|nr:hypothetical protein [Gammaproteobacteria bacterium]MDH5728268.1 hypothetical protein [Gammaproteobacteria bacterium]
MVRLFLVNSGFLLLAAANLAAQPRLNLPDPTRPFVSIAKPAQSPEVEKSNASKKTGVLTMTRISVNERVAVINGQAVREGEDVDGMKIIRIRANEVEYRRRGQKGIIRLNSGNMLRPIKENN